MPKGPGGLASRFMLGLPANYGASVPGAGGGIWAGGKIFRTGSTLIFQEALCWVNDGGDPDTVTAAEAACLAGSDAIAVLAADPDHPYPASGSQMFSIGIETSGTDPVWTSTDTPSPTWVYCGDIMVPSGASDPSTFTFYDKRVFTRWGIGADGLIAAPAASVSLETDCDSVTAAAVVDTTNAAGESLAFPVREGTVYHFRFDVIFRCAGTTTGIVLGVATPGFTALAGNILTPTSASAVTRQAIVSAGTQLTTTAVGASNTDYVAVIEGNMRTTTGGGTLQVQHGRGGTSAAVTVRRGSTGILTKCS